MSPGNRKKTQTHLSTKARNDNLQWGIFWACKLGEGSIWHAKVICKPYSICKKWERNKQL